MEEKTEKCPNCEVSIGDIETEERTIKCPICEVVIEDVYVQSPGLIARFFKWTGTTKYIDGMLHESWIYPEHPTKEIK